MSDNVNQEHTTDENSTAEETAANEQQTSEASSAEESNKEAEALRAELEEQQQRLMRAQADFDNFRRRTQKEKEELGKYASAKLITELLPVIDNFERAIASGEQGTDVSSYAKGVEMIFRQLEGVLGNEGLKAMETVGEPFNPEFHQAIMQVESDEHEEGIVVEEVQKGYMLKDKVLRPAMVKVSG
ncbi:nucleotide exchange factor GrpE [Paenibacillus woosongensis]|uniref:Protein GrpE n=1 Tax=Paenibacillus woosongensis TaxID=307580 RepID=A0A7X2Z085_9BACL|nr:nucleotide exchange factor GrpE [Paenibacillus woosongensis]MUG45082.1 nucleotide exchange factor GrpE [Paenibacillus woosongensis]